MVVGIASAGILVASPTIIQKETPPELMGRVSTSANADPDRAFRCSRRSPARRSRSGRASASSSRPRAARSPSWALAVVAARVPVGVGVELERRAVEVAEATQSASSGSEQVVAAVPAVLAGATKGNGRAPIVRPNHNKEACMSNVDTLKDAGIDVPDDQADAVNALSAEEAETLVAIKAKLDGTDEVAGTRARVAGDGGVVW